MVVIASRYMTYFIHWAVPFVFSLSCDEGYKKPSNAASNSNMVSNQTKPPPFLPAWEKVKITGKTPIEELIDARDYELLFPHRKDPQGHDPMGTYYTWENLVNASRYFPKFLNEGTREDRLRELAALFANKSQEVGITKGPLEVGTAEERYSYGLGYIVEVSALPLGANISANPNLLYQAFSSNYTLDGFGQYPAVPGQSYHGRGPVQVSHPANYGQMSERFFGDKNILLKNPNLLARNGFLGWLSAIWFWMEPQRPKPSCHDVMVGNVDLADPYTPPTAQSKESRSYAPTSKGSDAAGNSVDYSSFPPRPGLEVGIGMTFNIINGAFEADYGANMRPQVARRIAYYARYLDYFGTNKSGRNDGQRSPISPQVGGRGGDEVPTNIVELFKNWRNWRCLPTEGYCTPDQQFPTQSMPSIISAAYQSRMN